MERTIGLVIARLDAWLDGMRTPLGYGGPVVHWWRDSLLYCGPGLDWRYEGIISGYLTLFERTGDRRWLDKATTAGDDLVRGQSTDGTFRHSRFELNPGAGGRPHEAAVDIGLLRLSGQLRSLGDERSAQYLEAARRNLTDVYRSRLWSDADGVIRDGAASFVPNKAATAIEAFSLLAEQSGLDDDLTRVMSSTAEAILTHQVRARRTVLDGAISQATIGGRTVRAYFPYYVARCIPGLEAAYRCLGDRRFLDAAFRAAEFLVRWRDPDGGWPQVVYDSTRVNRYPRWVAGAGDFVWAFAVVGRHGFEFDPTPTLDRIAAGQLASGAIMTAEGFGSQTTQRRPVGPPDFRDAIGVTGWVDKAFHALALSATVVDQSPAPSEVALDCTWRGRPARFHESAAVVEVDSPKGVRFHWRKGDQWAVLGQPRPRAANDHGGRLS